VSPEAIAQILACPLERAKKWAVPLTAAMNAYSINTPKRQAAFIAQVGHESGRLAYVKELWGPTPAQERYEGRADLGNTVKGDGFRYRGRGLIQITGRANYAKCALAMALDVVNQPELLEQPVYAALSAAWFWSVNGLNGLADLEDFERITRRINGGTNGLKDRREIWERAKGVLVG
jgi:putative chitinase